MGNSRVIAGGELCAVCHNKTVQNMKNKISLLLVIFVASLLVVPQVSFAAWWNPVSWFEREKTIQLNATSTKNSEDLESATVFKSNNIPNNTDVSPGKTENKSSEFVNTVLNESNIENVAELKATIFQLQKEITLLQNKEQAKKTPTEPVEKIIYRDRIIEKPTEKIVYRDNITEKPTEKIIYQEKIVEKPVEKIVYRDRVIEKPVEKIIYQDRVVQGTCSANNITSSASSESSSSSSEYSDYNFDYKWSGSTFSCPITPRSIGIKKAVFKISDIPDIEVQKINDLKALEADGFKFTWGTSYPALHGRNKTSPYSLEENDNGTFVYFGGSIPICSDGAEVKVSGASTGGTLSDVSGAGRNIKAYLEQKGILIDGQNITISQNGDLHFDIDTSPVPVMSEWEVWDYTTNKPVKIK